GVLCGALALHALAGGDLAEATDTHAPAGTALGLHGGRVDRAVDVDAGRERAAAVADVLDGAVGVTAAAQVRLARRQRGGFGRKRRGGPGRGGAAAGRHEGGKERGGEQGEQAHGGIPAAVTPRS